MPHADKDFPICLACQKLMRHVKSGKEWLTESTEGRCVRLWRADLFRCPACGITFAVPKYVRTTGRGLGERPIDVARILTEGGEFVVNYDSDEPIESYDLAAKLSRSLAQPGLQFDVTGDKERYDD